jgi:hypothetical protein
MPFVFGFMILVLLLPLADMAIFGFKYVSAWGALRNFGGYLQYNPPPDVTDTSVWESNLQTSVSGYDINNIQVLCGDSGTSAVCNSANVSLSPVKFFSYTTSFKITPMTPFLKQALPCPQDGCILTYSERFQ